MMTGPVLIGITQSYLDVLNHGAVPTISSSWQSVEEAECRRAYDSATEVYMASFDRSKPPEEIALREAHEQAVQKSMAAFNASAVGVGAARKKFEDLLQKFFKKAFEDYKRNAFNEAELQCRNAIHAMEKRLRAACMASDAKIDNVAKVLDAILFEYEKSIQGPGKWQQLAGFLQRSFEGPVLELFKRVIDKVESEKSSLALQRRMNEDKMTLVAQAVSVEWRTEQLLAKTREEVSGWMQQLRNREAQYTQQLHCLHRDLNATAAVVRSQGSVGVDPDLLMARDQNRDILLQNLASVVEGRDKVLVEMSRLAVLEGRFRPGSGFNLEEARASLEASFANEAEIVFTTVSSSGRKLFSRLSHGFDMVVIDEAAQDSEVGVLPPFSLGAARCVLVGDPQQLPATVISKAAGTLMY
ncbi:helicase sen1-like [Lathyrus oleraceus]|uniref:helicase sen1-like n=1 Tax=Pisum sativum TaxID=3888 RepID=UPI0021CFB638|nr:helicase sen1-like [Pisum sativum]XP_050909892.1 helicase sen1-like [Pisum sativum]